MTTQNVSSKFRLCTIGDDPVLSFHRVSPMGTTVIGLDRGDLHF